MKDLRKPVREYVALRRALGYKLRTFDARLNEFVAFLKARKAEYITAALAVAWALESSQGRGTSASARLRIVRGFAVHLSASDARTEIPPPRAIPRTAVAIRPYIFTEDEILRLMQAARKLFSPLAQELKAHCKLRCHTYHCLIGLLAATGMRSGEAVRLRTEDVDLSQRLLTIRDTKFGKSRLVPIHATTATALAAYAARRDTFPGKTCVATFFISERRRTIGDSALHAAFRTIGARAGPPAGPD
jgi:integrase/recombinase XerD